MTLEAKNQLKNHNPYYRRTAFLHMAGPPLSFNVNKNTHIPGRWFPETLDDADTSWYRYETDPNMRLQIRAWAKALEKICGVSSLLEIRDLFKKDESGQPADRQQREEEIAHIKERIYERFREAFAQRHHIEIIDQQPSGIDYSKLIHDKETGKDYGIVLQNTRRGEVKNGWTKQDVDNLIQDSLATAGDVYDYLGNPQTGLFRSVEYMLPSHVNEPPGLKNVVDLLFFRTSKKWTPQALYEARSLLGLMDVSAEVILWQDRLEPYKEELLRIFDHEGVFRPDRHGPLETPIEYITLHDPEDYSVIGVKLLKDPEKDKYKPSPYILYNRLTVREAVNEDGGTYLVQLNDEPKGRAQTILKMMRRNTYDPADIRDTYRMAATFINQGDISTFLDSITAAGERSGKQISWKPEENSLTGNKYQGLHEGKVEKYAGSSENYQVMRVKMWFENTPDISIELSIYTLPTAPNYFNADNVNIGEYLVKRQLHLKTITEQLSTGETVSHPEHDTNVYTYLYPDDIYHTHISDYQEALIRGIRDAVREKAYVPNKWQKYKPIPYDSQRVIKATRRIYRSITDPENGNNNLEESNVPELVIALGPNSINAAIALSTYLHTPPPLYYDPNQNVADFLKEEKDRLEGKRILILDDVGDKMQHATAIQNLYPDAKIAVIALRRSSEAQQNNIVDYVGSEIEADEYVIFSHQQFEQRPFRQGAVGIVGRFHDGKYEILLQKENDPKYSDNPIYKLPGGKKERAKGDRNTLDALWREWGEELGEGFKLMLIDRMVHDFPLEVTVSINKDLPSIDANTFLIRGYMVDGTNLDIDQIQIPQESEVLSLEWVPIEKAGTLLNWEGHRELIRNYKSWLKDEGIYGTIYGEAYKEKYIRTLKGAYTTIKYKLVDEALLHRDIPTHAKILDIGCNMGTIHRDGIGPMIVQNEKEPLYFGIDVDASYFDPTHIPPEFVNSSGKLSGAVAVGESLPFDDSSVNVTLALDVLDHVDDYNRVLSEMYRVLKPEGKAMVIVPALYKLNCFRNEPEFSYVSQIRSTSEINAPSTQTWLQLVQEGGFNIDFHKGFGYALSMPYLFWCDEQFVPLREAKNVNVPTTGIHKQILEIINNTLTPSDFSEIDSQVEFLDGNITLQSKIAAFYPETQDIDSIWPLYAIPAIIRLHKDYTQSPQLQYAEQKLLEIVRQNKGRFSDVGKQRLLYVGSLLNDSHFLSQSGGNAVFIQASKN